MKKAISTYSLAIFIGMLACFSANAQLSQSTFGKNRVQYKKYDWKFLQTANFRIYYYYGGNRLAHNAARYLEEDFEKITEQIGYYPPSKITVIIYNSVTDLQQSNIGLNNKVYAGGETDLIKSKLEVAFTDNQIEFREKLTEEATELFINLMMFGGNFKDMVQNSYLLNLPDWFIPGISRYIAQGWSPEMHDAARSVILKKNSSPDKFEGEDAAIVGQSVWHYISAVHGQQSIASILALTRITHNEEVSISNSLGLTYQDFLKEWRNYYKNTLSDELGDQDKIKELKRLRRFNRKKFQYNQIAFNQDSTILAYSENYRGIFTIYLYDLIKGKRKRFFHGGRRIINQEQNKQVPLLAWRKSNELSVLYYRKGRPYMVTKNVNGGKKEKKLFVTFESITHLDYSDITDEIVLSASRDGRSDIFVYHYKKDIAQQITNDLYDDLDASYLPNSKNIVFSSNRVSDTIRDFGTYDEIGNKYKLYLLETGHKQYKEYVLEKLKIESPKAFLPQFVDNENVYFISEAGSMRHVHRYNLTKDKEYRISNYNQNIKHFSIDPRQTKIAFTAGSVGKQYAFLDEEINISKYEIIPELKEVREEQPQPAYFDTSDVDGSIHSLDIDEFVFESHRKKQEELEELLQKKKKQRIKGPYPYSPLFGADYVVSALSFQPINPLVTGLGGLFEIASSEMFGDHKLNANIYTITDLKTSRMYGEYLYLKRRNDFKISYEKTSVFLFLNNSIQRHTLHTIESMLSHPFSNTARIEIGGHSSSTNYTNFNDIFQEDIRKQYIGYKAEFVFDNTLEHGMNMLEGHRIKASLKNYLNMSDDQGSFTRFNLDIRNYIPILKGFTLASRGAFGTYFGKNKQYFLLGGTDNWVFPGTEPVDANSPLHIDRWTNNSNLLFTEMVTNIRGFNYNSLAGNNYLIFNLELRLPITRFLVKKSSGSSFLRNLQAVAFYDSGSAWEGRSPFGQDNNINTQQIKSRNFTIKAVNYENPFLYSYGFGFRSFIFNYYLKFDVAWAVENGVTRPPALIISMGYDF